MSLAHLPITVTASTLPSPARDSAVQTGLQGIQAVSIVPGSDRTLTFSGQNPPRLFLPGALLLSDPVQAERSRTVTSRSASTSHRHHDDLDAAYAAQQNSYVAAGDATATEKHSPIPTPSHPGPFLTAVDVLRARRKSTGLIVAFGDSITDGAEPPENANHRWPDILASRLITPKGPNKFAVTDAGNWRATKSFR